MESTARKVCFKCGRKRLLKFFYRHPKMADGHLGKCIDCTKEDVGSNYVKARVAKSIYEAKRARIPDRKAKQAKYNKDARVRNPEKYKARNAVGNALRDGRLTKQPCRICGSKVGVQAHHTNYSRPLDVLWECFKCHREKEHGQTVVTRWAS